MEIKIINKNEVQRQSKELSIFDDHFGIDSLKLSLPINKVTILDKKLQGCELYLIDEDSVLYETFKEKSYKIKEHGISTRYMIEIRKQGFGADRAEYENLTILTNAKLLESDYLKGITIRTIENLYDNLIKQGIVYFSFADFLEAKCTDVDIKIDFIKTSEDFSNMTMFMEKKALPFKNRDEGCFRFDTKKNKGLEFAKRTTKRFKKPYIKFYHKGLELINHSVDFWKKYLQDIDTCDLARIEFTVKNNKHFKELFGIENHLANILEMVENKEVCKKAVRFYMSCHMNLNELSGQRVKEVDETLKGKDILIYLMLDFMKDELLNKTKVQLDYNVEDCKTNLGELFYYLDGAKIDKNLRHRFKKLLNKVNHSDLDIKKEFDLNPLKELLSFIS